MMVLVFHSIEDAKQKSEYDKMLQLAEAKKASVRQMVNTLRDKFKTLMDKNCSLPEHIQINIKAWLHKHIHFIALPLQVLQCSFVYFCMCTTFWNVCKKHGLGPLSAVNYL